MAIIQCHVVAKKNNWNKHRQYYWDVGEMAENTADSHSYQTYFRGTIALLTRYAASWRAEKFFVFARGQCVDFPGGRHGFTAPATIFAEHFGFMLFVGSTAH